jgi:hypothetical protein
VSAAVQPAAPARERPTDVAGAHGRDREPRQVIYARRRREVSLGRGQRAGRVAPFGGVDIERAIKLVTGFRLRGMAECRISLAAR